MFDSMQVYKALDEAARDYPENWVDPNAQAGRACLNVYIHDDETRRCIASEVLHRLGVEDSRLMLFNKANAMATVSRLEVQMTPNALALLMSAQGLQDNRVSWSVIALSLYALKNLDDLKPPVKL